MKTTFKNAASAAATAAKDPKTAVTNAANAAKTAVTDATSTAATSITNAASAAATAASTAATSITNAANTAATSITNAAGAAFEKVTEAASTAATSITNAAKDPKTAVTNAANAAATSITDAANTAATSITNAANTAATSITNAFETVKTVAKDPTKALIEGFRSPHQTIQLDSEENIVTYLASLKTDPTPEQIFKLYVGVVNLIERKKWESQNSKSESDPQSEGFESLLSSGMSSMLTEEESQEKPLRSAFKPLNLNTSKPLAIFENQFVDVKIENEVIQKLCTAFEHLDTAAIQMRKQKMSVEFIKSIEPTLLETIKGYITKAADACRKLLGKKDNPFVATEKDEVQTNRESFTRHLQEARQKSQSNLVQKQ